MRLLSFHIIFFTPAAPFGEFPSEDKYHQPWSEPVRFKRGLRAPYHPFLTNDTVPFNPAQNMAWYANLNEPVRLKPGLHSELQKFVSLDFPVLPPPALSLQGWYNWLEEPVRLPKGLKTYLQQDLAYHPRVLPTPDITMTMAATETNSDSAIFALNVYSVGLTISGEGAKVSIIEVAVPGAGLASVREP